MKNEKLINELIQKVQLEKDQKAKLELLERCFSNGCKFARKLIKNELYTDLINPSDNEIKSLVYQAFERSVKWVKIDIERKSSFKSFYFSMIKFQIYRELKTTLNYRIISRDDIKKMQIEDKKAKAEAGERSAIQREQVKYLLNEVLDFLNRKNEIYAQIVILKYQGYANKEICKKLEISELVLKSRIQYIKKLIRNEFCFQMDHF